MRAPWRSGSSAVLRKARRPSGVASHSGSPGPGRRPGQASTSSGPQAYAGPRVERVRDVREQYGQRQLGAQRDGGAGPGGAGELQRAVRLDPHALEEARATAAGRAAPARAWRRPVRTARDRRGTRPAANRRRSARCCAPPRTCRTARRGGRWCRRPARPAPGPGRRAAAGPRRGRRSTGPSRCRPTFSRSHGRSASKSSRWAQASPVGSVSRSSVPRASTLCV